MMYKKHRRHRRKYKWAGGILLIVVLLALAGVRIHSEAIEASLSLNNSQRLFWKLQLTGGKTATGKLMHSSADALTLKTVNGNETWTTPQIISKTPLSKTEIKEAMQNVSLEPMETSWLTWRREDSIFYAVPFSKTSISRNPQSALTQGLAAKLIEKMPAGLTGMDEQTRTKALKAYREGKLEMKTVQSKMKTMDPKLAEQYRKKMQGSM